MIAKTPRSMYLSIFNSFRVIRCLSQCVSPKITIFNTFLFTLATPLGQSRYMLYGWKENSMLTNCLADCAHLTITVSRIDRARYQSKIVICSNPLAFDAPVRGIPCGISPLRLEWKNQNGVATQWWKNFEDIFMRFGAIHERDRHTDRRTPHAGNSRAYAQHRAAKMKKKFWLVLIVIKLRHRPTCNSLCRPNYST